MNKQEYKCIRHLWTYRLYVRNVQANKNTGRKENKRISYPALHHVKSSAILTVWELTCSAMNQRVREVRHLDRDGHSTPHLHAAAATYWWCQVTVITSEHHIRTYKTHGPSWLFFLYKRRSGRNLKKSRGRYLGTFHFYECSCVLHPVSFVQTGKPHNFYHSNFLINVSWNGIIIFQSTDA